jgi:RloB-like protein
MGKQTNYVKPNDMEKAWNKRQTTTRPARNIAIRSTFLIYCEGINTEPEYFNSFPIMPEAQAIGLSRSGLSLVEKVIELMEKQKEKDPDQQVWVVFDRDIRYSDGKKGDTDFNKAIKLAHEKGIKCAYSNDCFELWFILHREYQQSALNRTQYYEKLSKWLNFNYTKDGKGKDFAKSVYAKFESQLETAMKNAEKLHKSHGSNDFHQQNPCTTVYKLVEELRKNLRR